MRPTRVNTDNTDRLVQLYKDAYRQILNEFKDATDFGQKYRAEIAKNIKSILKDLGVETNQWIEQNMPAAYQAGMSDAVAQLDALGAKIGIGSNFTAIDTKAIQALMDDATLSFGNALSAVNRSAQQVFTKAAKDEIRMTIAQGVVTSNDRKMIVNNIKQLIEEDGISALEDKAGRSWTLDRYADMLARTKIVEARNTGLQNQMLENGYDLVQVSEHGATDVCADWEGEILSLSGDTDGYATVDEATADGLFHPNCQHAINAIVPNLAAETNAYNTDTGEYSNSDDLAAQFAGE